MEKNYLKIKKIKCNHVLYGFFTRKGGLSKKNYYSLNCSLSNEDNKNIVKKNIKIAIKELKIKNKKLKTAKQIHSNHIAIIDKNNINKKIIADGLITDDFSIALGVLTADCAPIFIFDKNKKFICCLHSGWMGTLKNIVKKSFNHIKKYNKNLGEIIVIIGPCLSKKNFEVSPDIKKLFIKKNKNYSKFFFKKNKSKDLFDMRALINFQFRSIGIRNIYNLNRDTYKNESLFFSHRRAAHKNTSKTGRMINIISFK